MVFTIPPGVEGQHTYLQDKVVYAGLDARIEYVGAGEVGNITIWDVYLAPGTCTRPLNFNSLAFAYEVGAWGPCPALCGIEAEQSRIATCKGSDGRDYTEDWACAGQKLESLRNCTGVCTRSKEENSAEAFLQDLFGPIPFLAVAIGAPVVLALVVVLVVVCACGLCRCCRRSESTKVSSFQPEETEPESDAKAEEEASPAKPQTDAFGLPPTGRRRGKRNKDDFYGAGLQKPGRVHG